MIKIVINITMISNTIILKKWRHERPIISDAHAQRMIPSMWNLIFKIEIIIKLAIELNPGRYALCFPRDPNCNTEISLTHGFAEATSHLQVVW